ncbi:MAG: type II toxin-antitoxin system HipA family toxin [Acidobacteriota bacterium]|nr:type II toxin-antitoxin system HipA family toxin [Acidobacteriota bacterium]
MTDAYVDLWGRTIGAVSWFDDRQLAAFQYTEEFAGSGIQVAPLTMPLRTAPYEFPELPRKSFKGLPGMLADCLPDRFGNALIDVWLAQQNRDASTFNPVERLCYTGKRGMGALEFQPALKQSPTTARRIEVDSLVELSNRILNQRSRMEGRFDGEDDSRVIEDILRVGTSAGGARAKAILAWNEQTGEFRSGQVDAGKPFTYWLMKFDGIEGNKDKEIADPQGYGRIEYAYYLMAQDAGIIMMPCRLHEEGGRAHFMTRRYDRTDTGGKLHYQSLAALAHHDFESAGAHSYEQAILVIKRLGLSTGDREQQIRRAFFNIIARNQDDHVKNIGFLMDRKGLWRLSPAFDVVYSYNPQGNWTSQHQMSLNGKRDDFTRADLLAFAKMAGMKSARASRLIDEIRLAVRGWPKRAEDAGVDPDNAKRIASFHRL